MRNFGVSQSNIDPNGCIIGEEFGSWAFRCSIAAYLLCSCTYLHLPLRQDVHLHTVKGVWELEVVGITL